jgi:hypothetical protein
MTITKNGLFHIYRTWQKKKSRKYWKMQT